MTTFSESGSATPLITLFPVGDSHAIEIPRSAYALRGFRDWALSEDFPSRGQFTFVDGELIIEMSPEYFETHNAVKTEITAVVYTYVKNRRLGRFFSDRTLLSNEAANVSTEPDATFARFETFRSGRCQMLDSPRPGVAQELAGSPDWVLEIVSTSSMRKDKKLLLDRYFAAGIGEYWLIDALGDQIDFQILVADKNAYVPTEAVNGWLRSQVFGCSFQLLREKDEDGLWVYTLAAQDES